MDSSVIGSLIAGSVAVVGPYLVYRINRRTATTDAAQKQIDQIQEDREADRKQFNETAARSRPGSSAWSSAWRAPSRCCGSPRITSLRSGSTSRRQAPAAAPLPGGDDPGMPGDR
jgi:hypothetical protein